MPHSDALLSWLWKYSWVYDCDTREQSRSHKNRQGWIDLSPLNQCQRCTSSMSVNSRSTNGHRFVFHSFEVIASERHYIDGEPAVIPYHPPPPLLCPAVHPIPGSTYPSPISINGPPIRFSHVAEHHLGQSGQYSDNSPTPPADMDLDEWGARVSSPPASFGPTRSPVPMRASPLPQFQRPAPPPRSPSPVMKLKAGDMLYWHHLSRNGEIPGVQEDPRARGKGIRRLVSHGADLRDDGLNDDTSLRATGVTVVCGR